MAEPIFTEEFVQSIDEIVENYKIYLIKESDQSEVSASIEADNFNDEIYDHTKYEAETPLARTRELINPVRKSKFDSRVGQLQLRSTLIPPDWTSNSKVHFLEYQKVFHASSRTHNSESSDDLFE